MECVQKYRTFIAEQIPANFIIESYLLAEYRISFLAVTKVWGGVVGRGMELTKGDRTTYINAD